MLRTLVKTAAAALPLALAAPAWAQEVVSVDTAVDAALSAGLVETLLSGDPYTVFLPTNAALGAAPQDALSDLVGNPEALATVIQGYVIPGTVLAADAVALVEQGGGGATVEALAGNTLALAAQDGVPTVNGAAVIAPNLTYGSLTVHVIDTAFLPDVAG